MKRRAALGGLATALVLAVPVASAAPPLAVAKVDYRDVDTTYSTEAVVEAVRQSTISAQVMRRIVELRVDVGDLVKAGQVVARIDERERRVVASSEAQSPRRGPAERALNLERAQHLLEQVRQPVGRGPRRVEYKPRRRSSAAGRSREPP
jgi:multidrug efflux pump subunit AcrA (membrane-fusion protein)